MNIGHKTAPHPEPIRSRTFADRIGWSSLRGRYLYATLAFTTLLLAAAWVADRQVRQGSTQHDANALERLAIRQTLRQFTNDIWRAQNSLHEFLLIPNRQERAQLETDLKRAATTAATLAENPWVRQTEKAHIQVSRLRDEIAQLQTHTQRLAVMRTTPEQLFPAMPVMLDRMLPAQSQFNTAATLAMAEAFDGPVTSERAEIYRAFAEARYHSTQMVGAFRLWVANRFGIFGEPQQAMRAQAANMVLYADAVNRTLKELAEFERRGALGLQGSESLRVMQQSHRDWLRVYKDVEAIYTSERWRADTPLLRDAIQPLFQQVWSNLRALEGEIESHSVSDMTALRGIAGQLSGAIWLLAVLTVMVGAVGFLGFEYSVRRPVGVLAAALRAEAAGEANVVLPQATTSETRDLVAAFAHMREQVRSRQERLETILDNAAEGIVTFDANGVIERFNKAAERLFGFSEREIVGKDIGLLIVPVNGEKRKDYARHFMRTEIQRLLGHEGEVIGRHKDGTTFTMALKISKIALEGKSLYTGLVADISERKAMVEHLKAMAEHDGLTGLYNRTYFQQELERVVERARRNGNLHCALLYIDLDNFKYVNDTLSHAAGDRLLMEVAGILHKRARKSDLIARFGGDEFTVLLYDTTPELAAQAAESFRKKLAGYGFRHEGSQVDIGCSIGVAAIGQQTTSAEEALSQADIACHLAKRNGRNQVHRFQATDADSVAAMTVDMGWSRRIKHAIENNRFVLACQPIVNTRNRDVEAYEVLIRMLDETDQLIMPSGFLPSAERFGLSVDIDRWVVVNAIETLKHQRQTLPNLRYAVNLSGQTLTQLSVCDLIQQKLGQTRLEPSALTFEVTETVAIADMAAAQSFLSRLREMGCRTALDDFGSGMSSFAYLKDLPVDEVKIDGRFVKNLATNSVDQAMVRAMNDIAHALGKKTVAEFVENEASFQLLAQFGVDYAQGYHLGRPDVSLPCKAIADNAGQPQMCSL